MMSQIYLILYRDIPTDKSHDKYDGTISSNFHSRTFVCRKLLCFLI